MKKDMALKLFRRNKFDFQNKSVIRVVILRHFEGLPDLPMPSSLPNMTLDKTGPHPVLYLDWIVKPPTQRVVKGYCWDPSMVAACALMGCPLFEWCRNSHYSSWVRRHVTRAPWCVVTMLLYLGRSLVASTIHNGKGNVQTVIKVSSSQDTGGSWQFWSDEKLNASVRYEENALIAWIGGWGSRKITLAEERCLLQ